MRGPQAIQSLFPIPPFELRENICPIVVSALDPCTLLDIKINGDSIITWTLRSQLQHPLTSIKSFLIKKCLAKRRCSRKSHRSMFNVWRSASALIFSDLTEVKPQRFVHNAITGDVRPNYRIIRIVQKNKKYLPTPRHCIKHCNLAVEIRARGSSCCLIQVE